jgi:SAM-dependent methyltransferase
MKKKQRIAQNLGKSTFKSSSKSSQGFWEKEYAAAQGRGAHLALSDEPSEDLEKFVRFIERQSGHEQLNVHQSVVDLGCGNGRNLIYLSREFGMHGTGFDIAHSAIDQAKKAAGVSTNPRMELASMRKETSREALPLEFEVRSIAGDLPFEDESQTLVLDMMVSHFLNAEQRAHLLSEVVRILKPGGWFFFKTFLLDEDRHAKRLLNENPGNEEGTYIHPEIKVAEHVSTEDEIVEAFSPHFTIHKIQKSHGHLRKGKAKRRSIVVYAEKSY